MTAVDRELLTTAKEFINKKDLSSLQLYWMELQDTEFPCSVDWTGLFQKLYLHACNKGAIDITGWFQNVLFVQLDPIQQIALRQIFPYGRYLTALALKREANHS